MTLAAVCLLAAGASASAFAPVAPHPRLFADEAEFAAAKERIASCEEGRAALGVLMRTADSTLSKKPLERKMEGRRLLGVSRNALERIGCLSFAWRYTGDRRYAERAAAEARAVCAFPDWNPSHFLDVGEMTLAVAIARDWLDGFLADEDKRALSSAILRKGLTTGDGKTLPGGWWVKGGNNWNQVCNGGLSAGAAAVRDEYPEVAEALLLRARGALPHAMKAYAGGNFPEGPGYWEYATDYTAVALDVLERQFADGVPELFATDGLAGQVDYLDSVTGPTGLYFNYSDPFTNPFAKRRPIASCWYLARRFGRADALDAHERALVRAGYGAGRMQPFLLLWLAPAEPGASKDAPLCRVMGGTNPIAVLRSGRGADDWYVGVKGGCPSESHGHMDGGSFVVDAGGVRWACDLGCEAYNRIEQMKTINLWNKSQDSSRWSLFRLGTEGHGTLVIDGRRQNVKGRAKISGENPAVVDLTPLYPSAKDVKRAFALGKDGLSVSDAIAGLAPGTVVTWNMNTSAKAVANGNRLVLEAKDGKGATRRMELAAEPSDIAWETESVAEPRTKADSPNPGMTRVRFRRIAGADGALAFSVAFRLLGGGGAKGVCNAEVCPERQNDFCWENDKFGMRAYGPGEITTPGAWIAAVRESRRASTTQTKGR